MEKTEQMYRFEQETGLEALVTVPLEGDSLTVVSEEYTRCLESKAEAYDRLSEKVGVWANGMNARFFNPMDFVFCSQQVAEEMKEYADGKE